MHSAGQLLSACFELSTRKGMEAALAANMLKNLTLPLLFLSSLGFLSTACDEADQAIDCNQICNRYQECFDSDYDVGACVDRCEPMLESDPHGADDCENCIDDRSCAGATFNCASECGQIVP